MSSGLRKVKTPFKPGELGEFKDDQSRREIRKKLSEYDKNLRAVRTRFNFKEVEDLPRSVYSPELVKIIDKIRDSQTQTMGVGGFVPSLPGIPEAILIDPASSPDADPLAGTSRADALEANRILAIFNPRLSALLEVPALESKQEDITTALEEIEKAEARTALPEDVPTGVVDDSNIGVFLRDNAFLDKILRGAGYKRINAAIRSRLADGIIAQLPYATQSDLIKKSLEIAKHMKRNSGRLPAAAKPPVEQKEQKEPTSTDGDIFQEFAVTNANARFFLLSSGLIVVEGADGERFMLSKDGLLKFKDDPSQRRRIALDPNNLKLDTSIPFRERTRVKEPPNLPPGFWDRVMDRYLNEPEETSQPSKPSGEPAPDAPVRPADEPFFDQLIKSPVEVSDDGLIFVSRGGILYTWTRDGDFAPAPVLGGVQQQDPRSLRLDIRNPDQPPQRPNNMPPEFWKRVEDNLRTRSPDPERPPGDGTEEEKKKRVDGDGKPRVRDIPLPIPADPRPPGKEEPDKTKIEKNPQENAHKSRTHGVAELRPFFSNYHGLDILQQTGREALEDIKEFDVFDLPIEENHEAGNPMFVKQIEQMKSRFSGAGSPGQAGKPTADQLDGQITNFFATSGFRQGSWIYEQSSSWSTTAKPTENTFRDANSHLNKQFEGGDKDGIPWRDPNVNDYERGFGLGNRENASEIVSELKSLYDNPDLENFIAKSDDKPKSGYMAGVVLPRSEAFSDITSACF